MAAWTHWHTEPWTADRSKPEQYNTIRGSAAAHPFPRISGLNKLHDYLPLGKVMFSEVSVCLQGWKVCLGGRLPPGGLPQGGSASEGLSLGGLPPGGSAPGIVCLQGVCLQRGFCFQRGVCFWGVCLREGLPPGTDILLACILVLLINYYFRFLLVLCVKELALLKVFENLPPVLRDLNEEGTIWTMKIEIFLIVIGVKYFLQDT